MVPGTRSRNGCAPPELVVVTPLVLCEVWVLPFEEDEAVAVPLPDEKVLTDVPDPLPAAAEELPALLSACKHCKLSSACCGTGLQWG